MGTINYKTSDYITLGVQPYDYYDFENDNEFMKEIKEEVNEYGGTVENAIYDYIDNLYECDYYNIKTELKEHHFTYYHVTIEPGYYEGFTINIENNYPVSFDSYEDRAKAQKEITEIKKFLTACAGMGLVKCSPGWCTGYANYSETITAINEAVKEMRTEAKTTPTWRQYEAAELS